jgi:hypothetical protein
MSKGKPQLPEWLKAAIATQCAPAANGAASRSDAEAKVSAAIREHDEFVEDLISACSHREVGRYLNTHASSGDLLQASLFPELPARMRISPSLSKEVAAMTATDLAKARRVLFAQTQNAINGATDSAKRKRDVFQSFYDQVKPLLAPGKTVRDVIPHLTAKAA